MAKGPSESAVRLLECQEVAGEHRRAVADASMRRGRGYWRSRPSCTNGRSTSPDRRFDDLFNLVADPAFLTVAWDRVRGNRGARSAGVDGVQATLHRRQDGEAFLRRLRDDLKARRFAPLPVRQRMIPKANGKLRRWGSRPRATGSCKPA